MIEPMFNPASRNIRANLPPGGRSIEADSVEGQYRLMALNVQSFPRVRVGWQDGWYGGCAIDVARVDRFGR